MMTILVAKVKVEFYIMVENSYNKTVIGFNFDRHKALSALKSDINLGLAASMNITFSGSYLIEVKTCIILHVHVRGLSEKFVDTLSTTKQEQ